MLDVPPLLDDELAQFLQRGVSINVASASRNGLPSVSRAIGCRIPGDRRSVVLFFSAEHAAPLLADLRQGGAIAAVFSMPTTHQTIQLKGSGVWFVPLGEGDPAAIAAYRQAFMAELMATGLREVFAAAIVPEALADVVAVSFAPSSAFVQTPGPAAGRRWQGQP